MANEVRLILSGGVVCVIGLWLFCFEWRLVCFGAVVFDEEFKVAKILEEHLEEGLRLSLSKSMLNRVFAHRTA